MVYKLNIENVTNKNTNYRKVLHTTKETQLVIMSVSDEIHKEKHPHTTQFIRVESGQGFAIVNNKRFKLSDGDAIIIPHNTWHYIKNTGKQPLKLYTLYSPPEHKDGLVQKHNPDL